MDLDRRNTIRELLRDLILVLKFLYGRKMLIDPIT